MSIRTWDYRCDDCGHFLRDWPYTGRPPQTIECTACGGSASWTTMKKNQIHLTHSGRKYGEYDPQFGCVVENYSHKQRLLREMGLEEVGDRWGDPDDFASGNAPGRPENVIAADTIDEVQQGVREDLLRRADGSTRQNQASWHGLDTPS